jgi:hypothetical protein
MREHLSVTSKPYQRAPYSLISFWILNSNLDNSFHSSYFCFEFDQISKLELSVECSMRCRVTSKSKRFPVTN